MKEARARRPRRTCSRRTARCRPRRRRRWPRACARGSAPTSACRVTGDRRAGRRHAGEAGRARLPARRDAGGRARHGVQLPGRPRDDPVARDGRGAAPRAAAFVTESRRSACELRPVPSRAMSACGSSAPSRCPDDVLDRLVAWQRRRCRRATPGSSRARTCTSRWRSWAAARRASWRRSAASSARRAAAAAGSSLPSSATARPAASACSSSPTRTGARGALAGDLHERLERLGVYEPEARPWLPHVTVVRFRERPRLAPPPARPPDVQSVRCCCLPFRAAADGAQYVVVQNSICD